MEQQSHLQVGPPTALCSLLNLLLSSLCSRLKNDAEQEQQRAQSLSLDLQRKEEDANDLREKLADYKKQIQQVQKEVRSGSSTWQHHLLSCRFLLQHKASHKSLTCVSAHGTRWCHVRSSLFRPCLLSLLKISTMREEEKLLRQKLSDVEKSRKQLQEDVASRERSLQRLRAVSSPLATHLRPAVICVSPSSLCLVLPQEPSSDSRSEATLQLYQKARQGKRCSLGLHSG